MCPLQKYGLFIVMGTLVSQIQSPSQRDTTREDNHPLFWRRPTKITKLNSAVCESRKSQTLHSFISTETPDGVTYT